jgi:hypothetical protein
MTSMVSSGFSNTVPQSTQHVDQWLVWDPCFLDSSGDIQLRQFIPVLFWITINAVCAVHLNERTPKTDLYKLYPPRSAYNAFIFEHFLILLFYIFIDPGYLKNPNICNVINIIPKSIYVMYILCNTHMWNFEISILYNCGCYPFILVNSLMMVILAETCCGLYNKQNKIVMFWPDI